MTTEGLRGVWRMDPDGWAALRAASDLTDALPRSSLDTTPASLDLARDVLRQHGALVGDPLRPEPRLRTALDLLVAASCTVGATLRSERRRTTATWALHGELAAAHVLQVSPQGASIEVRVGAVDELVDDVLRTLEVPDLPHDPAAAHDEHADRTDTPGVLTLAALRADGSIAAGADPAAALLARPPVVRLVTQTPGGMSEACWLHGPDGVPVRTEVVADELRVQRWPVPALRSWLVAALAAGADVPGRAAS